MRINLIRNLLRIGVGGVIGTAYFSVKNAEQIKTRCNVVHYETIAMDKSHKAAHYIKKSPYLAKPLLPTIACAVGSITCMAFSERISIKQIAALSATCAYLAKNRDFLEGKLKEVVGEEKLEEIKKEFIAKEAPKMVCFPSVEETGNGNLLCIEAYSGRWFRSSQEACLEAQQKLKDQYTETGYAGMNDYYTYLKISESQFGSDYGWAAGSDLYGPEIEFNNTYIEPKDFNDDWFGPEGKNIEEPVFVLEFPYYYYPMQCYLEY